MNKHRTALVIATLLATCLPLLAQPAATGPATTAPATAPTQAWRDLPGSINEMLALANLDDESKALLTTAAEEAKQFAQRQQAMADLPGDLQTVQRQLEQPLATAPTVPADMPVIELEAALRAAQATLAEARGRFEARENLLRRRAEDRQAAAAKIQQATEQLEDVREKLAQPLATEPTAEETAARLKLQARRLALRQRLELLNQQPIYYDATAKLAQLRRDLARRELDAAQAAVDAWQKALNQTRLKQTEQRLSQARQELANAASLGQAVEDLARRNVELAQEQLDLVGRVEQATRQASQAAAQAAALRENMDQTRQRVERLGLTTGLGITLRNERSRLPDPAMLRRQIRTRALTLNEIEVRRFDLEQLRDELSAEQRAQRVQEIANAADQGQSLAVEQAARHLLAAQQDRVRELLSYYDQYGNALYLTQEHQQQVLTTAQRFRSYIDERILWFRSSGVIGAADIRDLPAAAATVASPRGWIGVGLTLWRDVTASPVTWLLIVAVLALVFYLAIRTRKLLDKLSALAADSIANRFAPTLGALVLTVIQALPWPLLLWMLAWRLTAPIDASLLAVNLGWSFWLTGLVLLMYRLLARLCDDRGLAKAHFHWNSRAVDVLRANLRWSAPVVLPLLLLSGLMEAQGNAAHNHSLGRLAFIAMLVALSVLTAKLLSPSQGIAREFLGRYRDGWLDRLKVVWYPLAVSAWLALAALSAAGYHYTAWELAQRVMMSLWLVLALAVARGLAVRWLMLARRRLVLQRARHKQQADEQQAVRTEEGVELARPAEEEVSLTTVSTQTQRLVASVIAVVLLVGLWVIWADVLPAIAALEGVRLWSIGDNVTSLADLLRAGVIFTMTVIAAGNIPGLLEMSVLQRLPLTAGARFAITAVSRYIIGTVGVVATFGLLGIGWDKVQWLVAAMTVGLGFGLQEIFANFVSGLIILFERPMRVGDVVTVGDTSGTVTQIRIRATTITDWNRKELIVPNKEFITGRLINWTLSDKILRVVFPVRIAYGSDTELARKLLRQVAWENQRVLPEPEPAVVFTGFGDSALNFELRVYIPDLSHFIAVTNEINFEIDRVFRQHKVKIAFLQHDIHIRSIESAVLLKNAQEKPAGQQ